MRALLLAAGRGERMRPLTDALPKPLLEAGGRALIEHHLLRLAAEDVTEVVVNTAQHGGMIRDRVGDGSRYGVSVGWSDEGPEALETAGGIVHALPLLGGAPFAVINADIWTDYPFGRLHLPGDSLAHLVLVPNPLHRQDGDFALDGAGRVSKSGPGKLTFAGIGIYSPDLFDGMPTGKRPLAPLLHAACDRGEVSGERYDGEWFDIGTPERLDALRQRLGR